MNRQIKISIIVPVFNAEKYLNQCLDSILSQTLQEIEILCVDDGSTDGSKQILEEYREKDSRVKVFSQANQYAGCARNTGLEHASGKYVTFWDSDDYFRTDALEILYNQAERTQAQICVCGAFKHDDVRETTYTDNIYLRKEYLPEKEVFNRQDIPGYIFNITSNVPWNKLYLRSFLEERHLRFQTLRRANDVFFVMMALYYADRITAVPKRLIWYRTANEQSLTGKSAETKYCTAEAFLSVKKQIEQEEGYSEEIQRSFVNKTAGPLIYTLQMTKPLPEFRELFDSYKNGLLRDLGMTGRDKAYYYNPDHYEYVNRIEHDEYEEFLFWYAEFMNEQAQNWKVRCIASLNAEKRMKNHLDEVVSSTSYKVGRSVTWLPRSIKEQNKRKRRNKK